MNRGTLALIAGLVSCLALEAQAKDEAISPASAWLAVNEQALGVGGRRSWRNVDNPNRYLEVLSAVASGGFPRIELWFGQLYGNSYWSASGYDVTDRARKTFMFLKSSAVQEVRKTTFRNHLGPGEAAVFRVADRSCVAFQQFFGNVTLGRGNKDLYGYYCAAVGDDISDDMIAVITRQYGVSGPEAPPEPDAKALSILATLSRGTATAVPQRPQLRSVAFVMSWEGEADGIAGTMTYTQEGGYGEITIPVPQWSAVCAGRWQYEAGKYGTADLPQGTWSIGCSNGLSATGRYVSPGLGRGTGSGRDTRGRAVKVTFGP